MNFQNPLSPIFVLEVFVCECATTSTLMLGDGGGGGGEGRDIKSERKRIAG